MRSGAKLVVECGGCSRVLGMKIHRSLCAPTTSSNEGAKGSYGANRLTGTGSAGAGLTSYVLECNSEDNRMAASAEEQSLPEATFTVRS
jgi:hypothetical protein